MGTPAWSRHRPGHPPAIRRPAEGRNRLAISRTAPAREARMAEGRMGCQRGQPAREVLPTDGDWQDPTAARAGSLGAAGQRDRPDHEPRVSGKEITHAP